MTGILVNKGELKNIRDSIDKLLKLGKENVTSHTQYVSYESEELSGRHKKILKYVENNQGTIKEDVIKKNQDIGSRMTIVKSIDDLIEMRMLIVRPDDSNQHILHLYTNKEHVVLSLFNDLEFFKHVYFRLIDETIKKLKKLDRMSTDPGLYMEMWHLIDLLLMPYKYLIIMYITSDLLLWQELPLDKVTLHNKFEIVYASMKEIHTKLHESITPFITSEFHRDLHIEPLNSSLHSVQHGSSPEHILSFLHDYEEYRLSAFAEPVLDILWKISYPVLPNIDPLYASQDREALKDWRNIISGYDGNDYKPKTTQTQNLGKNNISG
ncbi:MAG: hypothetical protein WAK17_14175 [Candidatus Nitrosopolaris sp.]|jgi:hypothetical protein